MSIAIITGASSGLGAEFVRAVVDRYPALDEIWLIARRQNRLKELANAFPHMRFRIVPLDLGDDNAYCELQQLLTASNPDIRILINNAGYEKSALFSEMTQDDIQAMLAINIKGLTMVQRLCQPYMHKGSFTILTCSISSFVPVPHQAVYSATKKYVYFFGKALRDELRRDGVGVLLLCPGKMNTEMNPRNQMRQSSRINMLPYLNLKKLTRRALKKAAAGKSVYTPGILYKGYHVVSKLIPSAVMLNIVRKFY